jgi:CheY-like chemotaxis protein
MSAQKQSTEAAAFAKFLETRKILIADASATARSGLFKIFQELGAKNNQIILVNSFSQAAQQIAQVKPHIVVAEYDLGRRCGLDLLQSQRQQMPEETKQMVFIVVTGNTSQTAVAKAAEEDIDAYILKPFTPEVVRKTIMKAALMKISPPEYLIKIEEGKSLMQSGDLDGAEALFQAAAELDASPSLALYYLGQTKFLREIMDEARGSYNKGLSFNKIHYKCMVGVYDILMKEKNHQEAYEVVKKISQYFPANPKRLSEVLRLAITNAKYEDVEKYYSVFCNIDDRDETLIRYICAALVVCGKYYLSTKFKSRALELFQKAAATGTGRVKILREVVQALLDYNLVKEAKDYLAKFPPEAQSKDDYLIMEFQIINAEGVRPKIIESGRQLIKKGLGDERVYSIMIQRSLEAKLKPAAEALLDDAIKKFPKKAAYFQELFQTSEQVNVKAG